MGNDGGAAGTALYQVAGSRLGRQAQQEQQVLLGLQGHSAFLGMRSTPSGTYDSTPSPLPSQCQLMPSVASTLLLHSPSREVTRLLSPGPLSGSSISADDWVGSAQGPQEAVLGAGLTLVLAASLCRAVVSLGIFLLLTIFLPCEGGWLRQSAGADHATTHQGSWHTSWPGQDALGFCRSVSHIVTHFEDVGKQLWVLLDFGTEDGGELHLFLLC